MDILEYLDLTDEKQTDLFWANGKHIDTTNTLTGQYQLFSLYSFYVELTLTPEGKRIQRFSIFNSGARLDKYALNIKPTKKPWE